jgi:hypothetical protein
MHDDEERRKKRESELKPEVEKQASPNTATARRLAEVEVVDEQDHDMKTALKVDDTVVMNNSDEATVIITEKGCKRNGCRGSYTRNQSTGRQ